MNPEAWQTLLSEWAAAAIRRLDLSPAEGPLSGLGFAGATDSQLVAAEQRLGRRLPPSYLSFLRCSNGLRQPEEFVAARGGHFLPAEEIDWLRVRDQTWIDAFADDSSDIPDSHYFVYGPGQSTLAFRADFLRECLAISHDGDCAVCLLNPCVVDASGEWEAWFLTSWYPGANRYRSFAELMHSHHEAFLSDRADGF